MNINFSMKTSLAKLICSVSKQALSYAHNFSMCRIFFNDGLFLSYKFMPQY